MVYLGDLGSTALSYHHISSAVNIFAPRINLVIHEKLLLLLTYLLLLLVDFHRSFILTTSSQGPLNNILSTTSLTETLSRDYFLIIGRLSATQDGLRILDKTPGIFQHLMDICSMTFRDSLIKVCVIQLNS